MRHRRSLSAEQEKLDRVQGLKAIRDTWYQYSSLVTYDPEYVNNLERRIAQAELRIKNGL